MRAAMREAWQETLRAAVRKSLRAAVRETMLCAKRCCARNNAVREGSRAAVRQNCGGFSGVRDAERRATLSDAAANFRAGGY